MKTSALSLRASPGSMRRFRRRWFAIGHAAQFLALCLWIASPLGAEYRPGSEGEPVWYNASGQPDPGNAPPEGPDTSDYDSDGLPGWHEAYLGTDPYNLDSDLDLITDLNEITITLTNPLLADTDANGFTDLEDWLMSTQPNGDYEADGLSNAWEATGTLHRWVFENGE